MNATVQTQTEALLERFTAHRPAEDHSVCKEWLLSHLSKPGVIDAMVRTLELIDSGAYTRARITLAPWVEDVQAYRLASPEFCSFRNQQIQQSA